VRVSVGFFEISPCSIDSLKLSCFGSFMHNWFQSQPKNATKFKWENVNQNWEKEYTGYRWTNFLECSSSLNCRQWLPPLQIFGYVVCFVSCIFVVAHEISDEFVRIFSLIMRQNKTKSEVTKTPLFFYFLTSTQLSVVLLIFFI
jgi:hypothetical protein